MKSYHPGTLRLSAAAPSCGWRFGSQLEQTRRDPPSRTPRTHAASAKASCREASRRFSEGELRLFLCEQLLPELDGSSCHNEAQTSCIRIMSGRPDCCDRNVPFRPKAQRQQLLLHLFSHLILSGGFGAPFQLRSESAPFPGRSGGMFTVLIDGNASKMASINEPRAHGFKGVLRRASEQVPKC
jgi:hypothetical protein